MIEMHYQFNVAEMVQVTLAFLENRPFLKITIGLMKLACFFVLFAFAIKLTLLSVTIFDGTAGLFALFWLFYRQQINTFFLTKRLNKQKLDQSTMTIHILKHKIWWQGSFIPQGEQPFRIMRFIYQLDNGFIIPLIGLAQSAKFIWLPNRAFKNSTDEDAFLAQLAEKKIQLKKIK